MENRSLSINILFKAFNSLRSLDNRSKRLLKRLLIFFLAGAFIESLSLLIIYKLLNIIFSFTGSFQNSNNINLTNNLNITINFDIRLLILLTIIIVLLSGIARLYIFKSIYKYVANISHR